MEQLNKYDILSIRYYFRKFVLSGVKILIKNKRAHYKIQKIDRYKICNIINYGKV
jgi:hypothetical protein